MTDTEEPREDADVERLLALAGPRNAPPAELRERVHEAFMEAFDDLPESAPARRRLPLMPIAASIAAAFIAAVVLLMPGTAGNAVGEIAFASGTYAMSPGAAESDRAERIPAGGSLETGADGRVLVSLDDERSARLDVDTRVTLTAPGKVTLHQGRIYVDSAGASTVQISTRHGTVTDVGTLFEVSADGDLLTVAVREGRADVTIAGATVRSSAAAGQGELLRFSTGQLLERRSVDVTDARWDWISSARPGFRLAERSVADYLEWAAREGGRTLVFDSPVVQQQALLPGAFQGSAEVEADPDSVAQVLRTTRFQLLPAATHELRVAFRSR